MQVSPSHYKLAQASAQMSRVIESGLRARKLPPIIGLFWHSHLTVCQKIRSNRVSVTISIYRKVFAG